MILETRFDMGDEVFLMYSDKVGTATVSGIFYNSGSIGVDDLDMAGIVHRLTSRLGLTYKLNVGNTVEIFLPEHRIFKSKDELVKSL